MTISYTHVNILDGEEHHFPYFKNPQNEQTNARGLDVNDKDAVGKVRPEPPIPRNLI